MEAALVNRPMSCVPQPCAGLLLRGRQEPSVTVSRVAASIYRGHHPSKMPPAPEGAVLGVILQHLYSFGETQSCRFSWDTVTFPIHPPCLVSILVYDVQCVRWALAGPQLFIGHWSSFLNFLASVVPVKHRQVEDSVIKVALPLNRTAFNVSHEPFIMAQVTDGWHPSFSLGGPQQGPHSPTVWD